MFLRTDKSDKLSDIVYNNIHSDILNIIKTSGNITREHAKDTDIKLAHSLTKVFIKSTFGRK